MGCRKLFVIVTKLNKRNTKKTTKSILTFDFTALYTSMPQILLIKVLSSIINFVFKSNTWRPVGFSKTSIYWASKGFGRRYFTGQTLTNAASFLITKYYFTIGNLVFKQEKTYFYITSNLYLFKNLKSKGYPSAYKFHDDDDELFLWYGWPTKGV